MIRPVRTLTFSPWWLAVWAPMIGFASPALSSADGVADNVIRVGYMVERVQGSANKPPLLGPGQVDPNKSISKELQKQNGVLAPPNMGDPDIRKPVPEGFDSDMPVIAPPTIGGNQSPEKN